MLAILTCIVLSYVMCVKAMPVLHYQIINLTSVPNENSAMFHEVRRAQPFLTALGYLGCPSAALLTLSYFMEQGSVATASEGAGVRFHLAVAVYILPIVAFYLVKLLSLSRLGVIFASRDKCRMAGMIQRFIMAVQAMVFILTAAACVFYGFSISAAFSIAVSIVIVTEIWAFLRFCVIFFNKKSKKSHIFLYLCTLEAISVAIMTIILVLLINTFEIII